MNTGHFVLRDYQQSVVSRVREAWRTCRSVLVQMPTGTGKTVVLAEIVNEELRIRNEELRIKNGGAGEVWIVAHRRELVEQIEETVARYGMSLSDRIVRVLSIQWLSRHWDDMKNEQPRLIIIDEAHHVLAETYRELWRRFPDVKKLGMTATPCRLNGRGFTDLFDVMVESDGIADFIRQGWLSAFDYVSIRPDSEDQRLIDGLEKRGADGDFQVKEMDAVLNKQPTIERLYESVRQYAGGKRGIVYAVSISHARNIAAYYNNKGVNAVAIDSKTPSGLRRQLVDDFRLGKIQVLVNVDVFSEGFDCPDVEFVQLARPTLSLAKYLQQVGRGLRKTAGKAACVLIDNVGLYRLFGLPTASRDWQAMFEGRLAGKGRPATDARAAAMAVGREVTERIGVAIELELIVDHAGLLRCLENGKCPGSATIQAALTAFKDRQTGLFGLRRGATVTALPRFRRVVGIDGDYAAVVLSDGMVCVVGADGKVTVRLGRYTGIRILRGCILSAFDGGGAPAFIDVRNGQVYRERPALVKYGGVEMLRVGRRLYSRTRRVCVRVSGSGGSVAARGFYVRIRGCMPDRVCRQIDGENACWNRGTVCLLAGDYDDAYMLSGTLADGSIIVADSDCRKYYHVTPAGEKRCIASDNPADGVGDFDSAAALLKKEACRIARQKTDAVRRELDAKRSRTFAEAGEAVPFKAGLKWGLRQGDRVVVPPVYRSIRMPVGDYCAVEAGPRQWGVIMLDGRVVVETRYSDVEISGNGKARLTVFPGMTKTVDLSGM